MKANRNDHELHVGFVHQRRAAGLLAASFLTQWHWSLPKPKPYEAPYVAVWPTTEAALT